MPPGICIPGGTVAPAATRARAPIMAPSSTVAPCADQCLGAVVPLVTGLAGDVLSRVAQPGG